MTSCAIRLLCNSVACWVLSLNCWVFNTKLSLPTVFSLGLKYSFSSKNENLFFLLHTYQKKRSIMKILWPNTQRSWNYKCELKEEFHKIFRSIPVCTGKKASPVHLRQHIISANACENLFFVERAGNPRENPVLTALFAEFSKFTLRMMSHHLWISILYKSCLIIRVYSHSFTSTMKIEQEKRTVWLFYLRKGMSLKFFWFSWRQFFYISRNTDLA